LIGWQQICLLSLEAGLLLFYSPTCMNLHKFESAEQLAQGAAAWIIQTINETLGRQERCSIALSGGNTPKLLHNVLTTPAFREKVDWKKVDFFWGDERYVSFTDARNNAKMGYETLLNHLPVEEKQIHAMRTDIEPHEAAQDYEQLLKDYFYKKPGGLDILLLGMGDDGHTLSLFPHQHVVTEQNHWVVAFYLTSQEMYRITLTAPFANRSAHVLFLVAGESKQEALKQVLQGAPNPSLYPSQLIRPENGDLHWFVDTAAAALLD
jgi:6-phosphogluconolactonase